jgi:hypothetical protein
MGSFTSFLILLLVLTLIGYTVYIVWLVAGGGMAWRLAP